MAKTDNLIHYLTDVADAIREKEGSTDPINAQDFSQRIRDLQTGSEAGFLDYYYIDTAYESAYPEYSNLAFMVAEMYQTFNPVVCPLPVFIKCLYDDTAVIYRADVIQQTSGFSTENAKIAIPKYIYADNLVLDSGSISNYSFPEYNDFIQMIINLYEEQMPDATNQTKLVIEEMLEHQITKEQFWNE